MNMRDLLLSKHLVGGSGGSATVKNQHKVITENGVYTADSGYTGLGTVTVNVPTGGGSTGENKLIKIVARKNVELTAEDLVGLTRIGDYAFYSASNLLGITIPDGVTSIGNSAFYGAGSLSKIVIPESVTSISTSAFYSCNSLKNIAIPSGVSVLGANVLANCSILESVTIRSNTPPTLSTYAFTNCKALAKIIVPTGCGETYKAATNWSAYADIIFEEGEA